MLKLILERIFDMNKDQIKHLTERFLGWRLPDNFNPDAGIGFTPDYNVGTSYPGRHQPTGTNLFDYNQAKAMVQYMVEGVNVGVGATAESVGIILLALIEDRQIAASSATEDGDFAASLRSLDAANKKIADFIGENWPTIVAALGVRDLP